VASTEAEAFAELLRDLKDRSGRSYGVLAGKLHVSTSTLHRYCNGDAVPAEFGSVERLARLCGATSGELLELHRRWIIADEARRRARVDKADKAGAEPHVVLEAAPDAAPVPVAVPAPEPEPLPVVDSEAEAEPGAPARSRVKRLRFLLAAVAVVAVAVPAVVFGSRMTGPPADASSVAGGRQARDASPGPSASHKKASPSPSPSVSAPRSGSPSPSATHSPSGPPAAGHASGGGGKGMGSAVPVTVDTLPYAFEDPCSQHYLINRSPDTVPPPPSEQDAPTWVGALGGVASGGQYIALTVQGTGNETVVLQSLHVHVVSTEAPLAWTDYAMGVGCGGAVNTKFFKVNLDAGRPSAVAGAQQRDFPYKVSESDPEVFYVQANTSAHYVNWYLELDWSSGDRQGTLRVDDGGKPFRTSGSQGRPAYEYWGGDTGWEIAQEG
jgi:hypothetical protein